jgi:ubiquitin carboxyl-terminal hydrolase L5
MSDWCTIESDPGVFTELVRNIGVEDIQIEELMTTEPEELD